MTDRGERKVIGEEKRREKAGEPQKTDPAEQKACGKKLRSGKAESCPEDAGEQQEDDGGLKKIRSDCLRRCGFLLGGRDYSVSRLRQKLLGAGYPECIVEETLCRLREAGYLDDVRFAKSFIRSHLSDRSCLRISRDLTDRGIEESVIGEAFEEFEKEELESLQTAQIRRLLEKRKFDPASASFEEKQKTMAFLHRRGFPAALIRRGMEDAENRDESRNES